MLNGLTGMMTAGAFGAAGAFREGMQRGAARHALVEAAQKNRRDVAAVKALGAELRAAREQLEIERRRTAEAQAQAGRLAARVMALEAAARRS